MKGIVALLTVALCQFAAGAHISSCKEEINHAEDKGGEGGVFGEKVKYDDDHFLRAATKDYELEAAGFHCAKLIARNRNGKILIEHVVVFSDFNIKTIKEQTNLLADKIVPGNAGYLVKSVVTAYDFNKDEDYFQHEERVRHPGITYYRTIHHENDIWVYWECDRHAPVSETADDNRYFYTPEAKTTFAETDAVYGKFNERKGKDGFEGELFVLPPQDVERCIAEEFLTGK